MKHKFFLAIAMIVTCSIMISAFIARPFAYTFSSITPELGEVKDKLELSQAIFQTKGKTSTTSSTYNISGIKSTMRIKISEAFFQAKSDQTTGSMNPADYISLYKITVGKSTRSFTIKTDGSANAMLIPIVFRNRDLITYRVTPSSGLLPGEYAFIDKSTTTAEGNVTVWTFGID